MNRYMYICIDIHINVCICIARESTSGAMSGTSQVSLIRSCTPRSLRPFTCANLQNTPLRVRKPAKSVISRQQTCRLRHYASANLQNTAFRVSKHAQPQHVRGVLDQKLQPAPLYVRKTVTHGISSQQRQTSLLTTYWSYHTVKIFQVVHFLLGSGLAARNQSFNIGYNEAELCPAPKLTDLYRRLGMST